jgi:hypothetical protein
MPDVQMERLSVRMEAVSSVVPTSDHKASISVLEKIVEPAEYFWSLVLARPACPTREPT